MQLFDNVAATVSALKALGSAYPGITGFNFDLEVSTGGLYCGGGVTCAERYSAFLSEVKVGLGGAASKHRVTADASCSKPGQGWAPVISNCSLLATGGDLFMNMATYNAGSYTAWLEQFAIPIDDATIPRSKLGAGLGCWIESTVPAWSLTAESAKQRVCALMNASVTEIDMYVSKHARVRPAPHPTRFFSRVADMNRALLHRSGGMRSTRTSSRCLFSADVFLRICFSDARCAIQRCRFRLNPPAWPQPWWIPELGKFMRGGGCVPAPVPPPPPSDCPAAGWESCDPAECNNKVGCCTVLYNALNATGCSDPSNKEACAEQQCKLSKTKVNQWVPRDYAHNPYTCCPPSS